jgi:4-methyl-5(b-hydroxyethyl)-thiazole monophosphate biosynthesis
MSKVLIPLAEGFEELEAVSLIDVLRRAKIEVIVAGIGAKYVSGAHHIKIETECMVSQVSSDELDMIVLPGGWGGTKILAEDRDVQALLKEMQASEKMIGAICAAPFALKEAGVLSQAFTCYPSVEENIRLEGYTHEENIVIDGKVMTSRGPGTALCFGLAIVEKLEGPDVANGIKSDMLADHC